MLHIAIAATLAAAGFAAAADLPAQEFKLLATNKTSTMEKEMNEAAASGFAFTATMGGESAFGGNEVIVVMARPAGAPPAPKQYKLLATRKTSTMQKEMQAAADEGFRYRGQTIFDSSFGGREVAVILEHDSASDAPPQEFLLLATSKTSTMQKELAVAGAGGYQLLGMTVAQTGFGGKEVVCILARPAAR